MTRLKIGVVALSAIAGLATLYYNYWYAPQVAVINGAQDGAQHRGAGGSWPGVEQGPHEGVITPATSQQVVNTTAEAGHSTGLPTSNSTPSDRASEASDRQTMRADDERASPRFSPEWLSAVTHICDSPILVTVQLDDACKVLRKDAESIAGGTLNEGDPWPEYMRQTLVDFANSSAARNRIQSVSATCDTNGCLLFLEGSLGKMFQYGIYPDAQSIRDFRSDMAQQTWATDFVWPCPAGGCPYNGVVARWLPVHEDIDDGFLLVFLRRRP